MSSGYTGNQRGQAILMVSLGIMFLMGVLGLAVDLGWAYYQKQVAQAAADAVVLAAVTNAGTGTVSCGANNVLCETSATACNASAITGSTSSNLYKGCQYATANGIATSQVSVTANTTSPYNGASVDYWVHAQVSVPVYPTFLKVIGVGNTNAMASATGAIVGSAGSGGGCLYVLDSSSAQALYLNGAALALTCGVYINSGNTTNAFQLNSAAACLFYGSSPYSSCPSMSTDSLPLNMVTGAKISCSGCGCETDTYYGSQNPSNSTKCATPSYGSAIADPLSSLPAPSYTGCNQTNYSWSNLSPAQTLNPGVYCGGIKIGGGNVTFNPGTYVLNGGGLTIQGSNTTVSGTGVFFYNTSNGYTAGPLLISGQPTVSFTSDTSGTYQGIFFMQDHSVCPSTSHAINGNTNIKLNGTVYLHCTQTGSKYVAQNMLYTGESSTGFYSALVVDTLQVNGESNLVLDPSGGQNTGIGLGGGSKPVLIQ